MSATREVFCFQTSGADFEWTQLIVSVLGIVVAALVAILVVHIEHRRQVRHEVKRDVATFVATSFEVLLELSVCWRAVHESRVNAAPPARDGVLRIQGMVFLLRLVAPKEIWELAEKIEELFAGFSVQLYEAAAEPKLRSGLDSQLLDSYRFPIVKLVEELMIVGRKL